MTIMCFFLGIQKIQCYSPDKLRDTMLLYVMPTVELHALWRARVRVNSRRSSRSRKSACRLLIRRDPLPSRMTFWSSLPRAWWVNGSLAYLGIIIYSYTGRQILSLRLIAFSIHKAIRPIASRSWAFAVLLYQLQFIVNSRFMTPAADTNLYQSQIKAYYNY